MSQNRVVTLNNKVDPKKRLYQPLWEEIKTKKIKRVSAKSSIHRRIINAVIKEKTIDLAYKLEMAEKNLKATLDYKQVADVIEFRLLITQTLGAL